MHSAWHIFSSLFCSWKTQTKQNYYVILRNKKYIFEPNIEGKLAKSKTNTLKALNWVARGHSLIWPWQVCAAEQGMVGVLNRVYNFTTQRLEQGVVLDRKL